MCVPLEKKMIPRSSRLDRILPAALAKLVHALAVISRAPLLFVVALAAIGCGSSASTSTSVTAPASTRCEANVSSTPSNHAASGGTGTLNINVARECSWVAASPVSWIAFTASTEGQGPGSVSYRVAENDVPVGRQASVTVADRQVSLTQQAAPCTFEVGSPPANVGSGRAEQ